MKKASTIFAKTEVVTDLQETNRELLALEEAFGTNDIAGMIQKWHDTMGQEKKLEMAVEDKQEQMAEQKNYI